MEAANATALDYLYGFAVHFYANPYTLPEVFDETKKQFPSKVIINTESCEGSLGEDAHVVLLGSWSRAQDYVLSYMQVRFLVEFRYEIRFLKYTILTGSAPLGQRLG